MDKMRRWARDQRGSILLFTTVLVVPLMIIIGGLAMDLAYYGTVDDELQRSMDAAALAGAGKLGFNDTYFPAARQWARDYALLNPYRVGNINLDLNTANNPGGNIVLGIWNGNTFTPSLDGTQVNAVQCRFATTVPTSFLRLIGLNSLNTGAMAIAWAAQPGTTPPNACVFPVALSSCSFGGSTSSGCGGTITLISSSPTSNVGGSSAGWASIIPGEGANANDILGQVQTAASGSCSGTAYNTGEDIPLNEGHMAVVINWLMGTSPNAFPAQYANSPELVVKNQDGSDAYRGKGWEVFVPVVDTGPTCPPAGGTFLGSKPIQGWTRMVITQVLGSNGQCAVNNPWQRNGPGNPWDSHCFDDKNGTSPHGTASTVVSGQTGIFGYYDCQYQQSPPAPNPGPITATAKLKLVR
jgi:Flp pilus assembly protein TadG